MNAIKSVSVCGLGKLGACMAATFAARGFNVVGVDIDREKVAKINAGEPPVDEPLLAETIKEGRERLRATNDPAETVATAASFFIPPSPSLPDGSFSTEYLLKAMQPVAQAVRAADKRGHIFVCSSTTTPGAVDSVLVPMLEKETGWKAGKDFGVCYNPEFIALGNVVNGLLEPDMVLIGESDPETGALLEELYRRYIRNKCHIARMSIISAELTKISVNSYITMKISFTNQLRMIAEKFPKADINMILDAIGTDTRIGKKYLRAGLSFGGPCFPRDNRLLAYTARQNGLQAPLAEASDRVNEQTKENLLERVTNLVPAGASVAVLGMSYKPDTYITEESAGVHLAQNLKRHGYRVLVHDFAANTSNSPALIEFEWLADPNSLAKRNDVDLAVICCPWPQYRSLKFSPSTQVLATWQV
ncbi:MAG TPA: nucleotide sugar dehydrogenase [Chthoniobacterales bacterium]|jgi:UDPglucose 6-dehydrogenase|nr:nucleotide sugar dehydrogenase [Chthoniobacterales bacterium]